METRVFAPVALLTAAAMVLLTVSSTYGKTEVGGDQSGTWTLASSPYVAAGDITIPKGRTLTIEPGVIVKFTIPYGVNHTRINVVGTLDARGTESRPIVFTAYSHDIGGDTNEDGTETEPAPGAWVRINFSDGSNGVLEHCKILYAGNGTHDKCAIRCNSDASPAISNCEISYSAGNGIEVFNTSPIMKNNTFSHIENWPMVLSRGNASPVFEGNTFESNGHNGVLIANNGQGYVVIPEGEEVTWHNPGVPCVTDGRVQVGAGATLMLKPGLILKFTIPYGTNHRDFTVKGTLNAQGTASEPIVFTAYSHDIGGDTNGDGTETEPAPGDWVSIIFSEGSGGALDHCRVLYAGQGTSYRSAVRCFKDASPTIANCEIAHSYANGIEVYGSAAPTISPNNILTDFDGFGVLNEGSATINAKSNWWGDASGPYHETLNTDGKGVKVSDRVDFQPYLKEVKPTPVTTSLATDEVTAVCPHCGNLIKVKISVEK